MRHALIILLALPALVFLSPAAGPASAAVAIGANPAEDAFNSVYSADMQRIKAARDPKAAVELATRMLATAKESKSQRNSEDAIIFSWPLPFPRRSVNGKSVLCPQITQIMPLATVQGTYTFDVMIAGHVLVEGVVDRTIACTAPDQVNITWPDD